MYDVRKPCECCKNHDDSCNRTVSTDANNIKAGEWPRSSWHIVGTLYAVEPKQRDVDGQMQLKLKLMSACPNDQFTYHVEGCTAPVDVVETHEALCCWNMDETSFIYGHNVTQYCTPWLVNEWVQNMQLLGSATKQGLGTARQRYP